MAYDFRDVARVALSGTFNGRPFVNVIHFLKRDLTPMTQTDLSGIHLSLSAAAASNESWQHIWQSFDSNATIDTIYSRTESTVAPIERTLTVSLAGTSAANDAPPMLAALVKWNTNSATRSFRGRTYFSGLNVGYIDTTDSDRIPAAQASTVTTRCQDFVTAWAADPTFAFIVFSRLKAGAGAGLPYSEVTSGACQRLLAVQRRRRG